MRRLHTLALALSVLSAAACGTGGTTAPQDPSTVTFAPSLGVNLSAMTEASDGLYTQDLVVGTGTTAASGMTVTVDYTGWLTDGTQFGTTAGSTPLQFTLGAGAVIPGWDQGIVGMKVGGTRLLVIPSYLAYGETSTSSIPAGSILVFKITLLNAQ